MRYELAHDSLARQILDRVSTETKARRQAELLIARAYKRYQERQVLLTREDLDEVRPHEKAIAFTPEEKKFLEESKAALSRAARRKQQFAVGIISVLSFLLIVAIWQWQRSLAGTRALRAKTAYESGQISAAFRLAQSADRTLGVDDNTQQTITEVLQDIYQSGLIRDLVHPEQVQQFDVSPGEQHLLSTTKNNTAYVWDMQGRLLHELEHPEKPGGAAFIPWSDNLQAITYAGKTAYFWDANGALVDQYELQAPIRGLDFNERKQLTLLWSADEVVILDGDRKPWTFSNPQPNLLNAAFSPNDNDLLLASPDSVTSWFLDFIRLQRPMPRFVIRGDIRRADYIASDRVQLQTLVQFADSTSRVFDAQGQLDTASYYQYLNRELERLPLVQQFDFSRPGYTNPKTLILTDSISIRYWSAYRKHKEGERIGIVDFYTRYDDPITGTAFSAADQYLLTASADGRTDIWKIKEVIERYKRFRAQIRQAKFISDDKFLVTRTDRNTIQIWTLEPPSAKSASEILEFYDTRLQDGKIPD